MKKYSICFFAVYCICFLMLYLIYPDTENEILMKEGSVSSENLEFAEAGAEVTKPDEPEMSGQAESTASAPEMMTNSIYLVRGGSTEIVIYYPNESSVYKRIPILHEELSYEDREELKKGIYFGSLDELYHYLESITS